MQLQFGISELLFSSNELWTKKNKSVDFIFKMIVVVPTQRIHAIL